MAPLVIPDQPVLSSIGAVCAIVISTLWAHRSGLVWWKALLAGGGAGLCGAAGGRVLWAIVEWEYILANPFALVDPFKGGATSFGALAGATLGAALALRLMKVSIWRYADVLAPPGLIGIAFARVGCLMRSCDFGRVTDLPWAVQHSMASRIWRVHLSEGLVTGFDPMTAPIHPFPLYLVAWGLCCFLLVFRWPELFGRAAGQRAVGVAALWCLGRFAIEFVRHPGDAPRVVGDLLNLGHMFALTGFAIMVSCHVLLGRRQTTASLAD